MGNNIIGRRHRQLKSSSTNSRRIAFSNDVTVLCTIPSAYVCGLAHCAHGEVQDTIERILHRIDPEDAPLSVMAVSSSWKDETSLMQTSFAGRPVQCNEMDAPLWYPHVAGQENQAFGEDDVESDLPYNEPMQETDESEEDDPDDPSEPHPPESANDRQSAIMFHLREAPVHAMLYWFDFGTMMAEIALHFSVDREELLECHELKVRPPDIPDGVSPLIIQMVQDIPVGHASVLVLLDLEIHGQHMESNFQVGPRIERAVIAVPQQLTRHALLMRANVFEYCRLEHFRCLVECNNEKWPLQLAWPRPMAHGDYVVIKIPPPRLNSVCTTEALDASRAMQVQDFWTYFYVPSSPSQTSTADDVSPSLVDSEDIRAEFGHRSLEDDQHSLMQQQIGGSASFTQPTTLNPYELSLQANHTCVLLFNPHNMDARPLWFRNLVASFSQNANVENDDEGPALYISTWYVDCRTESTNEDSRVARLDVMSNMWVSDIRRLWRDKIAHGVPVFFTWVRPTPLATPLARTAGHLIVYQYATSVYVPVLLSFHFKALNLDGVANAVASIARDASAAHIVNLANLERVCRGRKCTFHRGAEGMTLRDPLQFGEGLKLVVPPPGGQIDLAFYTRTDAVELVETGPSLDPEPGLSMLLEDQPVFVQDLFHRWQQLSRRTAEEWDNFLEVTTWYLDGVYVSYNDQSRPVLLGSDFHNWISEMRRVWHDLEDAGADIDFAFVNPIPASSPLETVHVLLFQNIETTSRGILVTKYDNAVLQGRPFTAATIVPSWTDRAGILQAIGRSTVATAPDVHCSVWYERLEVQGTRMLEPAHGDNINVHIHRQSLVNWEGEAAEDVNLLQLQSRIAPSWETSPVRVVDVGDNSQVPPPRLRLAISPSAEAMDWYESYFTLPAFDIEHRLHGQANWHPDSLDWIRTAWYAFDDSVTRLRIYYDGSFLPTTGKCGFAAAAFVMKDQHWYFAGTVSGTLDSSTAHGSYQAEVFAANLAVKMLFDFCKVLHEVFACYPHCELIFDSLTVGRQVEGLWQAQRAVHACHLIRSVLRVCEARFCAQVQHIFQHSHTGEPGNELVDVIARCAAQGFPLQDWTHFLTTALAKQFVQHMEWAWMLFDVLPDVQPQGDFLAFPAKPRTKPAPDVLPMYAIPEDRVATACIRLQIATCNILTLRSSARQDFEMYGMAGPARQDWVLSTFHQSGIHVFGLQETHLKRLVRYQDPRYVLIKSSATDQGHFGMMIGLSKLHEHGTVHDQKIFFNDDSYRILHASPRSLIVRICTPALRCILVAVHAPHSGAEREQIEHFWQKKF